MSDKPKQRIVCAAIKVRCKGIDRIICSQRHHDKICNSQLNTIKNIGLNRINDRLEEQVFVDQFGDFLTRKEAFVIAKENGQIIRECGNPGGDELYSEHLY